MSVVARLVSLGDVDLLLHEARDERSRVRLRKLGFQLGELAGLEAARARLAAAVGPRWLAVYERARLRYGVGVAPVRERVCQGCFVTLPTSTASRPETQGSPGLCECCGRVLFWGSGPER
jgi:predicted  nucleic acid-binding Zn-ribbon protein